MSGSALASEDAVVCVERIYGECEFLGDMKAVVNISAIQRISLLGLHRFRVRTRLRVRTRVPAPAVTVSRKRLSQLVPAPAVTVSRQRLSQRQVVTVSHSRPSVQEPPRRRSRPGKRLSSSSPSKRRQTLATSPRRKRICGPYNRERWPRNCRPRTIR